MNFSQLWAQSDSNCASGEPLNSQLEGNLGLAPTENFDHVLCFEVKNDTDIDRYEIAYASVPIRQSLNLLDSQFSQLAVIGPSNQVIASSYRTISRWGQPLDNSNGVIKWLQVAIPAKVLANSVNQYALRLYDVAPEFPDPFALTFIQNSGQVVIDSQIARFTIDENNPAIFNQIEIDHDGIFNNSMLSVYAASVSDGPMLVYANQGQAIKIGGGTYDHNAFDRIFVNTFDSTLDITQGHVTLDSTDGFQLIEANSVMASYQYNGHFVATDGSSLCQTNTTTPYEKFGFSTVVTFYRGLRHFDLDFEFRNECSDASSGPWVDDVADVEHVSWNLTLSQNQTTHVLAMDEHVVFTTPEVNGSRIQQHLGGGENWQRRAGAYLNGQQIDKRKYYQNSTIASMNTDFLTALQMPFMRFREPQALEAVSNDLRALLISEPIIVGEGKGIWNSMRYSFLPLQLLSDTVNKEVAALKQSVQWSQERGLLLKADLLDINAARVMPSLGNHNSSLLKSNYLAWMNMLHQQTVSEDENTPGQWLRNKNFGSQYWPDTGGNDPFGIDTDRPNNSFAGMNYWDPAGLEILEFQRSGEPQWAWELSIPVYRNMVHSAYLNTGKHVFGNRAGVAVQSGGPGCEQIENPPGSGITEVSDCTVSGSGGGQWHRSNFGSDDYTYDMSLDLAYVTRPNSLMRDRFMMAGMTMVNRYDVNIPENLREDAVNVLNNTRQVIQHFEMLANCAEFVPGNTGLQCHNTLTQLVEEISRDNHKANLLCQGYPGLVNGMNNSDIPVTATPTQCLTPQQFMTNSLIYPFYYRYLLNYGDTVNNSIRTMLMVHPLVHLQFGIDRINTSQLNPFSGWWSRMFCQLDPSGTQSMTCTAELDSDGNTDMWAYNKPHTAALLYLGNELDSNDIYYGVGFCNIMETLYDTVGFTGAPGSGGIWDGVQHFNQAGWWKGPSQMLQSVIFAVGNYDTCQ